MRALAAAALVPTGARSRHASGRRSPCVVYNIPWSVINVVRTADATLRMSDALIMDP